MTHHPRRKVFRLLGALPLTLGILLAGAPLAQAQTSPRVSMKTSMGEIVLELYPDKAPTTVANFLDYAKSGFYNGTVFHRVIDNFMIQGGGFDKEMNQKPTKNPIENEAKNGLRNEAYTVAMARTASPHSATAQFFINVRDNAFLDYPSQDGWGYCVFGKVVKGMEVVNKMKTVETTNKGMYQNVPVKPIVIQSVSLIN